MFNPKVDEAATKNQCRSEGNCVRIVTIVAKTVEGGGSHEGLYTVKFATGHGGNG